MKLLALGAVLLLAASVLAADCPTPSGSSQNGSGDISDSGVFGSLPTPIADAGFTYKIANNAQLDIETGSTLKPGAASAAWPRPSSTAAGSPFGSDDKS